ncbi:MAG: VLRF1 family aeRF1-type release factor [Trueperaceae bacterium]
MIGSNLKLALIEQIDSQARIVLSLYLNVNPANPDNTEGAITLRAAEAMRQAGVAKEYISAITTRLSKHFVRPEGRTLVIFAGEDPTGPLDAYYLQTDLPFLNASDGVIAHWGKPLVAPLLFVLDQRERYGVLYVATDRVRMFEAFLGQVEEHLDFVRAVDTDEWRTLREARRSPAMGIGVAARGGADVDSFQDRMEEATARLYRNLLPDVEKLVDEQRMDRLILVGQPPALSAIQSAMSKKLQDRLAGTLPPPTNPEAAAHEWQPLVQDLIAETELKFELELLDKVREGGVWGVQETLNMLQDGRLHTVMVPWTEAPEVWVTSSGRVAATMEEAAALRPGEEVLQVRLMEVLTDLVQASGTILEFAEGGAEERLNSEFGGMAGITRW